MDLISFKPQRLEGRGLHQATLQKGDYGVGRHQGETVHVAQYRDSTGTPVAQKIRTPDKRFFWLGTPSQAGLFLGHRFREGGKRIVITEGELDCLSVYQLFDLKWPVVSLPNGAAGARKDLAKELSWLSTYETVVLAFDQDEAGRKAMEECASLFAPGQVAIAQLPDKDASESLQNRRGSLVVEALWSAKPWRPQGILKVEDLRAKVLAPVEQGIPWPWPLFTEKTHGRRLGQLVAFGGGSGTGKSDVFKEMINHDITLGYKVGAFFLEESPTHTIRGIAGKRDGVRYHVPGLEYDPTTLQQTLDTLDQSLLLYNSFGVTSPHDVLSATRHMAAMGCQMIYLDHITALVAAMGDKSERKEIDQFMAELAGLCQDLDLWVGFASHLATPQGKSHEEGGRVCENQFRGSRAIAFWSHCMIGLERDKQDPNDPLTLRILKDRYVGTSTGTLLNLNYDPETGRLLEAPACAFESTQEETPP